MRVFEAIEVVKLKLSERTRTIVGYWLMLPLYISVYILFEQKSPDPLGKYGYYIETGVAKYD